MELVVMIILLFSFVHGQSENGLANPGVPHSTNNNTAVLSFAGPMDRDRNISQPIDSGEVDRITQVLGMIESERKNCTPGTALELAGVVDQYAVNKFIAEAQTACNRANELTQLWKHSPEMFSGSDPVRKNRTEVELYAAVWKMVESTDNIYSAGICYDWHQYPGYDTFCPFASRMPNSMEIITKDLAKSYDYRAANQSEWFYATKEKALLAITRSLSTRNAARKENHTVEILSVGYEEGHWSTPYYDCGGANIWMVSYTVPFFGFNWTTHEYQFMGTVGVGIDLRRVDINQCPSKTESVDSSVFAGSAKCKPTTQCEPIHGLGFVRGGYKCACLPGYHFPDKSAYSFFHGTIIEQEYDKFRRKENNSYETGFSCLPCSEGCTAGCTDGSTHCGI